jgi:hypothetical protein
MAKPSLYRIPPCAHALTNSIFIVAATAPVD